MRSALCGLALLLLGGCSIKPALVGPLVGPSDVKPSVDDILKNIQCEIRDVQNEIVDPNNPYREEILRFQRSHYVAYINLTLDVTHNEGLTPGLTFLNDLGTITGTVNFQASGTQHRNINPTLTLDLSPDPDIKNKIDQICLN